MHKNLSNICGYIILYKVGNKMESFFKCSSFSSVCKHFVEDASRVSLFGVINRNGLLALSFISQAIATRYRVLIEFANGEIKH